MRCNTFCKLTALKHLDTIRNNATRLMYKTLQNNFIWIKLDVKRKQMRFYWKLNMQLLLKVESNILRQHPRIYRKWRNKTCWNIKGNKLFFINNLRQIKYFETNNYKTTSIQLWKTVIQVWVLHNKTRTGYKTTLRKQNLQSKITL